MLTIMLATILLFSSCVKVDKRDDYVGSYRTNWTCIYGGYEFKGTYTLTITKSSANESDIILSNISNSNESARATVNGNAFTIPQQTIFGYGFSGSGTLSGNVLNFSTQETESFEDWEGNIFTALVNLSQVATKQ